MADRKKDLLDSLFEGVMLTDDDARMGERKGVTLWLPSDYQQRWMDLQHKTKKKFGKRIRDFVIQAIDRVDRNRAG